MVEVVEPVTEIRLDTPAGLVIASVQVEDGHAAAVTIKNVPSFVDRLDATVQVPGLGEVGYDLTFGGNFYAVVDLESIGLPFERKHKQELIEAGLAIMEAINVQGEPVHPERNDIRGCHHVYLKAPAPTPSTPATPWPSTRWFDRSPCGTGTSARMAQLHARGELELETDFVNESFIGSQFTGRLVGTTTVGQKPAVIPTVTGRAWVTGTAQYFLDPTDPFPEGFIL